MKQIEGNKMEKNKLEKRILAKVSIDIVNTHTWLFSACAFASSACLALGGIEDPSTYSVSTCLFFGGNIAYRLGIELIDSLNKEYIKYSENDMSGVISGIQYYSAPLVSSGLGGLCGDLLF